MLKVIEYDGNLKGIAQKLNNRKEEISIEVNNAVNDIINDIRKNGNQALNLMVIKLKMKMISLFQIKKKKKL